MINWKVRLRNKNFWITLVPAIVVLAQAVGNIFGIGIDFNDLGTQILTIINAVFVILSIVGIINDPTTAGLSDSAQAMTYETPKE